MSILPETECMRGIMANQQWEGTSMTTKCKTWQRCVAVVMGLVLAFATPQTTRAENLPDSKGTEFWLMFGQNLGGYALTLFITSEVDTSGTIDIPGLSHNDTFSITAGTVTSVTIPTTAMVSGSDTVVDLGIHVEADDEVTIYGLHRRSASTDAYLGLPVDILGTEYICPSYHGGSGSWVTVLATEDGTTISVTPKTDVGGKTGGATFTQALDQGEIYVLKGTGNEDITGTLITADAPVAVNTGNVCTNVPSSAGSCDHLEEMVPPTSAWGRNFVTMPLKTRLNGDTFRFVAVEDDTEVTVNGSVEATLDSGEFHEDVYTDALVISATKPILCLQYSNGSSFDSVTSDPFMMLVFPYEQFQASYTISTPATGFSGNYVNIVAPEAVVGSLELDDSAVAAGSFSEIGSSGWFGAQLDLTLGTHTLSAGQPFGVFVYGFDSADSYGYPGGGSLSPINSITSLTFTGSTTSGSVGNSVSLPFKVADNTSAGVGGARVDFTISGANGQTTSAVSNTNGVATLTYDGDAAGTDTITASINGLTKTIQVTWSSGTAPTPQLMLSVRSPTTNPKVGETASFETTVTNNGDSDVDGIQITMQIPSNTELVSVEQDDPTARVAADYTVDGSTVTVTIGTVAPGSEVKVYLNLRVIASGELKITASAAGQDVEAEFEAESTAVDAEDVVLRVVTTTTPAPLCGILGFAPLMIIFACFGVWRHNRRRSPKW